MLGAANYQAQQQGGGGFSQRGFSGQMNPEDLFRKIFEEFTSGGSGGSGFPFQSVTEFTSVEVSNFLIKISLTSVLPCRSIY